MSGKEGSKGERVGAKREGPSGVLRAVKELLVELGAACVVARGDHAYWQGISGERGCVCGDALIVYRKGLVLKRCCGMWMTGSQMELNIWMGGSARTWHGEVHACRLRYSRTHHCRSSIPSSLITSLSEVLSHLLPTSMKTGRWRFTHSMLSRITEDLQSVECGTIRDGVDKDKTLAFPKNAVSGARKWHHGRNSLHPLVS